MGDRDSDFAAGGHIHRLLQARALATQEGVAGGWRRFGNDEGGIWSEDL
jgi:hypothetical protein